MILDEAASPHSPSQPPLHQERPDTPPHAKKPWFIRLGERTHPLLLPVVTAVVLFAPYFFLDASGSMYEVNGMTERRRLGTLLLFALLPAYVLAMQYYSWRVTVQTVEALEPLASAQSRLHARRALERPGWWMWLVIVLGTLFGLNDFSQLSEMENWRDMSPFEVWFPFVAALTWATLFWILVWRLHCALEFRKLGLHLTLDVYQLDRVSSFVHVPLFHLLILVGALVFMPLQSLDFELRWFNFRAGLIVAVPSVIALVLPPIWGLHVKMRDTIKARVAELQIAIDDCDRSDFGQLALLTEHRETVRDFNSWPLDVGLVGKVLFYVFIPPLAWVAAALVEQLVDKAVG